MAWAGAAAPGTNLRRVNAPSDRSQPLPWRAIVIGAVILPPFTYFGMVAYIIVQTATWMGDSLLRGPLLLLFLITLLALGLRRLAPRLALTQMELLIIFAMVSLGTAMCGTGWAMFCVPTMAGSARYYAEGGNAAWLTWIDLIPSWFMVQNLQVVEQLHLGQATLYDPLAFRAILPPTITWSAFMILLVMGHHCLAQLVARPWIEKERLTFPLTVLPLAMTDVEQPSFWRNRLMWLGFLVAALAESHNSIAFLIPTIPALPIKLIKWPAAAARPMSGFGSIWTALYPFMIGIAFLLPLDISLSFWFFYLFTRVQDTAAMMLGFRDTGGWSAGLPPYHIAQNTGAVLVFAVLLLYRVRGEIAGGLRGTMRGNRTALLGLLASLLGVCWLCANAGIPTLIVVVWYVLYLMVALVMGRLVAESGIPTAMWPLPPQEIIYAFAGTTVVSRRELVSFTWLRNFDERYADTAIMHHLTGFRLQDSVDRKWTGMHVALAVAAVVGVLGGMWALLQLYFKYGLASATTREWPARAVATGPWRFLQGLLDKPRAVDVAKVQGIVAGGVVMSLLIFLRSHYAGFPLHPIGYAVSGNWAMQEQWFPFLVAWAIKLAILRGGGMRLYRKALPFFLGLILGDLVVPVMWAVVGVVTGQQMYLAFPH